MRLKTAGGKTIEAKDIDYILKEQITGLEGTTVRLKNGQVELVLHSEQEVVDAMNKISHSG